MVGLVPSDTARMDKFCDLREEDLRPGRELLSAEDFRHLKAILLGIDADLRRQLEAVPLHPPWVYRDSAAYASIEPRGCDRATAADARIARMRLDYGGQLFEINDVTSRHVTCECVAGPALPAVCAAPVGRPR
jgi:hypothetical protein